MTRTRQKDILLLSKPKQTNKDCKIFFTIFPCFSKYQHIGNSFDYFFIKLKQFLQRNIQVFFPPYRHRHRTSSSFLHLKQIFAFCLIHQRYQKRSVITENKLPDKLNKIADAYLKVFSKVTFCESQATL